MVERARLRDRSARCPIIAKTDDGDLEAVGEMTAEIKKDGELIQEVMATLQDLTEKTQWVRKDDEIKQDAECLREAKKRLGKQMGVRRIEMS